MVTGSFTLVGIEDMYAYIITCSSGSTIPTKADGTCKSTVTVSFKKKTDDGLVVFAAPKVVISVSDSGGTELATMTYTNRNAVDVTEMINTAGINSYTLNVSLYDGNLLLASENFLINRDTDVYKFESSTGSVVQCDEHGNVIGNVVISVYKNDEPYKEYIQVIMLNKDDSRIRTFVFNTSEKDITENIKATISENKIAPYKILVESHPSLAKISIPDMILTVTYRTPTYIYGKSPWEESNVYKNGNYIEYEGLIYLWDYPIAGNSTLNPKEDVAQNPLTTKWKVYPIDDLLAARVLLADFAKVGQAIFMQNYILSQHGKDASGASSTDYTQFPTNFIPAILLNMVNGDGHLAHKNIYWDEDGTMHLKQDFVYDWINIGEYSEHYVDFMKGSFIELSTGLADTQAYTLWERTNNTSCRIAYRYATRSNMCAVLNTAFKFLPNNWADLDTQFQNGGDYIKLKAGVEIRLEYNASKEAWLFDPGQYQVTISNSPDIGEIDSDIIIFNY